MPGPIPKDAKTRQRRNKQRSHAILPAEYLPRKRAPKLPKHPDGYEAWHDLAIHFWKSIWSSPMHFEWLRGDEPALMRLMILVDTFWRTRRLDYAREIRLLEREFGLTPLSRRRLEWQVAQSEGAKDKYERKRIGQAKVIDGDDPREVLG